MVIKPSYDALEKRVRALEKELTVRQQAEEVLREHEERMKLAVEGGELGTWDWYVQTGKVLFNGHWAKMLDYPRDEIGMDLNSWKKLVHPDDLERIMEILDGCLEGRTKSFQAEHRIRAKSGEWKQILGRGKVFSHDSDGKAVRLAGTNLDITELKQGEEKRCFIVLVGKWLAMLYARK